MADAQKDRTESIPTTRLAPSPTGALHLGNARTFLINWAMARQRGWRILLRIEDLDGPRVKADSDRAAIEDLEWLGLDWDEGPNYQRIDLAPYQHALDALGDRGLIYPCTCTRSDIRHAQSAPHEDDHELRYPGTCRPTDACPKWKHNPPTDSPITWRLLVPDGPVCFTDGFHGRQTINVQQQVGDFIVSTKSGLPAYQLAVVVDDARQGVTDVVRGDDLLRSTGRQLLIYRLLAPDRPARYWHVPLVVGPDGRRLAKRHGDSRIAEYRRRGVTPQRAVGLLAYLCGTTQRRIAMDAAEFCHRFRIEELPSRAAPFADEDHAWLFQR